MPQPSGFATFLFTDIEGSTRLWEDHPEAMRIALQRHDAILRTSIESCNGYVFKTVGDAFCAAFQSADDALSAAIGAQLLLAEEPWRSIGSLRVRMGLHSGPSEQRDDDYFGPTLNRTARLQGIGHGQQILMSSTTYAELCGPLPEGITFADMGLHRMKDLAAPEHVWQVNHPSFPPTYPPLRSLNFLATNLPQQITSFVGRAQEMAEARQMLSSTRLLTFTGSGGTGKTRLAVQLGAELVERFTDGVWLVELAALSDPGRVVAAISDSLSLREEVGRPLLTTLLNHLKDRNALLILDNCEHVLDAAARFAEAALKSCPDVSILASSREALGITGEHTYRVPSLSLPPTAAMQRSNAGSLADPLPDLADYAAVRLFIDRAQTVKSDFALTVSNSRVLGSICRRLDGIPLAIELAAARIRSMPLEQIEQRLDSRFRLLTGGSRTALPRQQTLRALIDWSYDLLSEPEKRQLRKLSVFSGGWTLEAAQGICADEDSDDWQVLDLLTSLSDKSLIAYETAADTGRYHMLETVRQYARDRLLESGEADPLRASHRDWYLTFIESAEPSLSGEQQVSWLIKLETEHDNLRAALEWSLASAEETNDFEHNDINGTRRDVMSADVNELSCAYRICGAMQRFWVARAHLTEGREWCMRTIEASNGTIDTVEAAKTHNVAGGLAYLQGDYSAAMKHYSDSLAFRQQRGTPKEVAGTLTGIGLVAMATGDADMAREHLEKSASINRQSGELPGLVVSLNGLGQLYYHLGDFLRSRTTFEENLALTQISGDRLSRAATLGNLAAVAQSSGDEAEVLRLNEESLALYRELGNQQGVAACLNNIGKAAMQDHRYDDAERLHQECLKIRTETGDRSGVAASLNNLGVVLTQRGRNEEALDYIRESIRIKMEIGDCRGVEFSLRALASLAARNRRFEFSATLAGAGEQLRELNQWVIEPSETSHYAQEQRVLLEAIGEKDFDGFKSKGRSMSILEVLSFIDNFSASQD